MERGKARSTSDYIYHILLLMSLVLIAAAVIAEPSLELIKGLWRIMTHEAGLITDPIVTGGLGAALLNTGLVLLGGVKIARYQKLPFTGATISCLMMVAGFALIGKNILNMLPIVFGTWLFAQFSGENFVRYVYLSLFGTCMSPMVSYVLCSFEGSLRWVAALGVGVIIGFFLPPIAAYTTRIHQGYNLYNAGFSAGFVGMAVASVMRGFGMEFETEGSWSEDSHLFLLVLMLLMFGGMILWGIRKGCRLKNYRKLFRHSGRAIADFVVLDDLPVTLVNMGVCGMIGLACYLLIGVPLNGPLVCCLMSLSGFAAFGKHPKNILPVMAGAVGMAMAMSTSLQSPSVLLACIFCTGLAPIAGQFGPGWGMIAGALHMAIVLNTGALHGGMNLYNNGFTAGLVCVIMIPLIEALNQEVD